MFTSSSRRVGGNPNRWLLLAGAGLLALGFVLRLMMDIGRTGSTAAETAAERTAAERTAAEPTAAETTAAEPTAAETTVAESKAAEPTAAERIAAEPTVAESKAAAGSWVVQLGVFSTEGSATKLVERARALGYTAVSAPVGTAGKYRVRVAGFATRTDAQAAADSLGRGLGLTPVVLR